MKKSGLLFCLGIMIMVTGFAGCGGVEVEPIEDTTFISVSSLKLPGQVFRLRMPECIQQWVETAPEAFAKNVTWEKKTESLWQLSWDAPEEKRREYLRAFSGEVRSNADTIDVHVCMKNPYEVDWQRSDMGLFCFQAGLADKFHDPEGLRTYIHQDGRFVNIHDFEGDNFKPNTMGSAYPDLEEGSEKWAQRCDARLMAKVSDDGQFVIGIASETSVSASWNLNPVGACIHQNVNWGILKSGQEKDFKCRVYILKGSLDDLWQRYVEDYGYTFADFEAEFTK